MEEGQRGRLSPLSTPACHCKSERSALVVQCAATMAVVVVAVLRVAMMISLMMTLDTLHALRRSPQAAVLAAIAAVADSQSRHTPALLRRPERDP